MSEAEPVQKEASDSIRVGLTSAVGLQHSDPSDGVKGVRVRDASGQRLSAAIGDDGSVRVQIEGKGVPGAVDEVPACKILIDRLNSEGGRWVDPEARPKTVRENGVDVVAKHRDGGEDLQFQVTRVDPDPDLWADLSNRGVAEKIYASVDAVADALQAAILKKLHRPQEGIILVLNGTQLPIGLLPVREAFVKRHGEWLRDSLNFHAVWVVESFYNDPWTFQLYRKAT